MLIGLCGSQGAGKSTLGAEFAKRNPKFAFAATSVSAIMRSCGMDPAKDYPLSERIPMQERILAELDAFYGRFDKNTVFDRTPLDAAAYMLADVQRENVGPEDQQAIARYVQRCFDVTNRRFHMICFIPAVLQHAEVREGKAPSDPAYVEHIGSLILGLCKDMRMKLTNSVLPRSMVDLEERTLTLTGVAQKVLVAFQEKKEDLEQIYGVH